MGHTSRTSRATWAKRVERWKDSGLTAKEFAAELGIDPRTLSYWKWRLAKEQRERGGQGPQAEEPRPRFVELVPTTAVEPPHDHPAVTPEPSLERADASPQSTAYEPFAVTLVGGERIEVPARFTDDALTRLLRIVAFARHA